MTHSITPSTPRGPEWRVVHLTNNLAEAHVIAGLLQSEQIPAMVHQEAGASAFGITVGRLGEIKVLVSPDDYLRALAVLDPDLPDELPDTTSTIIYPAEDDDDECE